jgi:transposase
MIPLVSKWMESSMRGSDATSGSLFSYVDLDERVPAKHPLRTIRAIVNDVLLSLDAEFGRLYEGTGRQSIAPERLLRASLLQAFYSVRSERQLMEQIDYNLLFRWFVGLGIDDAVWDHSTFSKNRDRLLDADVAAKFLEAVLRHPKVKRFLSDDHFSVDGTLVEAWASLKSFRAKDGSDEPPTPGRNGERDFHGEKRANETHESQTDPDAKLFRKGNSQPAKLYFMGHALIENRHSLVVQADATEATGKAERQAALGDRQARPRLGAAAHARCRQGLRHLRLRRRSQAEVRDAARRAEGQGIGHRWPHDTARGLCRQPAQTQAGRGGFRLGQDHRRPRKSESPWPAARALQVHLRDGRLQSDPHAEAARRSMRQEHGPGNTVSRRKAPRAPIQKYASAQTPSSTAC